MRQDMSAQPSPDATPVLNLAWLADAPMFIDSDQVTALYNAVVKPEYQTDKVSLRLKDSDKFKLGAGLSAGAELGLADWLRTIFPFLGAKANVKAEGTASGERQKDKERSIELSPIDTPQRQLVQLSLHYFVNLPERFKVVILPERKGDWLDPNFISALPRALVFVEFPPETPFVPMAVELGDGKVELIYSDLLESFVGPKVSVPKYPEPAYYKGESEKLSLARKDYWAFFRDNFSSTKALEAVEAKASGGDTIRWIDYRVPLGDEQPILHLSVSAHGRYHTGTFAYRWVKRGYKHGLRVVGTMKSEPAMNVLAVFER